MFAVFCTRPTEEPQIEISIFIFFFFPSEKIGIRTKMRNLERTYDDDDNYVFASKVWPWWVNLL